ncbi:MAG: response regulator [Planctomycetes bacterium]|nr:response regulator [Planctomycetota bacterium]
MSAPGLMLCDDLIFYSRVSGTARAAGLSVRMVRTVADLVVAARAAPPGGVIVDVHFPDLDLPALLASLKEACAPVPRVIAYGSHVEAAVLKAARAAGCDLVLPRSAFVEQLEAKIAEWLTPTTASVE